MLASNQIRRGKLREKIEKVSLAECRWQISNFPRIRLDTLFWWPRSKKKKKAKQKKQKY